MYCLDDGKIKCSNVMSDLDLKNTEAILYHVVISTIFASKNSQKYEVSAFSEGAQTCPVK